jgi:hypothetical protein
MLFVAWPDAQARVTRDLDFLGLGSAEPSDVAELIREICSTSVDDDDGLAFDTDSISAQAIRLEARYGGVRTHVLAMLGRARIEVQIDVGFGDVVVPGPREIEFPVLLDFPAPRVRAYPVEVVVAEKLEALVSHGPTNSRLKDFYDLWMISGTIPFDGSTLVAAVTATFNRRGTVLDEGVQEGLRETFYEDEERGMRWRAFLARAKIRGAPADFAAVGEALRTFLLPVVEAFSGGTRFDRVWREGEWR